MASLEWSCILGSRTMVNTETENFMSSMHRTGGYHNVQQWGGQQKQKEPHCMDVNGWLLQPTAAVLVQESRPAMGVVLGIHHDGP